MGVPVQQTQKTLTKNDWLRMVAQDPVISVYFKPDAPLPDLSDTKLRTAFVQPYFLSGLEHFIVFRKSFENFVARLRHALLKTGGAPEELAAAVASYMFNTEYTPDVTEYETRGLRAFQGDATKAALRACYAPLHAMPDADNIRATLGDCPLAARQIDGPRAWAKLRESIPAVTEIGGGVSALVRGQYEESPYPQWREMPVPKIDDEIRKLLPEKPQILVAGCGTGQETIQLSLAMPTAEILAVDLSLSSLSYATAQAARIGLRNISFRQADILRLGNLDNRFDYISCMGVLHHMEDPLAGWRVLRALLKPQGIMAIGLYSEAARQDVVAARAEIARHGFQATPDGIRAFRRKAAEILPRPVVDRLEFRSDYYFLSMCRDLLFHVQEHRFDIPRIASALQELKLDFIKFKSDVPPSTGTTLDDWQRHEAADPMIFANMYRFWCRAL